MSSSAPSRSPSGAVAPTTTATAGRRRCAGTNASASYDGGSSASITSSGVGRSAGSFARHRATSGASSSGTPPRSGWSCTTWYATMYGLSESNGPRPVAACTITAPSANTSTGGPTSRGRWNCSGAMYGGEPISLPVSVRRSLSYGREIPKSMTFGPPSVSSTLLGFRSRWITPARWMSRSASASPAVSLRSAAGDSGPFRFTCSASVGPGT